MTFPLVQIKAVETLLKTPKIGVSEIAKKSDLVSFEKRPHWFFYQEEFKETKNSRYFESEIQ